MEPKSCIVQHFEQFAALADCEIELLHTLERDLQHYPAGSILTEIGSDSPCFFTLQSGWACAVRQLFDGQRQVLDIFLPGQIMGLREIGFDQAQSEMIALVDVEACPFPRKHLREIFRKAPRLADLFFLVLAREQAMLTERIINIGRRPANERLAHFLLEMKVRLNQDSDEFDLPINQTVIGDALGLSSVHVSRTLGQLREHGLLDMERQQVFIRNLEGLVKLAGFDRTYLNTESAWARLD